MKKSNFIKIFLFIISIIVFGWNVFLNSSLSSEKIIDIDLSQPEVEVRDDKEEKGKEVAEKVTKEKVSKRKYISVKNSDIYKNDNYRGSLAISGTNFVEPLYQYTDNDYYLTHDGLGRKKSRGATYLDYRVSNESKKILIYGHNNDSLSLPFSILENYNYYDYYKEHSYLTLNFDGKTSKYQIFSVYIETSNWDYMKVDFASNRSWENHLNDLKDRSLYDTGVDVSSDDKILILQTCSKNSKYKSYSKKYMLVIAKLVK